MSCPGWCVGHEYDDGENIKHVHPLVDVHGMRAQLERKDDAEGVEPTFLVVYGDPDEDHPIWVPVTTEALAALARAAEQAEALTADRVR